MALTSRSRSSDPENRVLVGRDRELCVLDELLARLPDRGSVLVVRGEAGIGKSALVAEASHRAEASGVRVLNVTGVRSEAKVSFAGLHQLLRPILGGIEELPRSQRDAMLAAFGMSDERAPDIFLIALAALNLMSESAGRTPLLLIVEDVHWLDRSTSDVLAFVGRRLESDPIVLLIACRDGVENPLQGAGLPEVTLGRLDETSAAELLDLHAPGLSAPVRRRLLEEADGNPLALVELPISAGDAATTDASSSVLPLTERMEQAFAARASDFPSATEAVLVSAALNDGDSMPEILAAASIVEGRELEVDDFSPAIAARLVDADIHMVRFRHPLMRSAIHQAAPLGRRRAVHAALAAVLDDQPERRVWHRAASTVGPNEEVAAELEQAAVRAQRRGALGAAAAGLETSARLSRPGHEGPRLLRAAEVALELGRREMVRRLVREAEPLPLSPLDLGRVAWIAERLDPGITGDPAAVLPLVKAADQVREHGDADLALNLLWAAASNSFWADKSELTRNQIEAAAARVPVEVDDPRVLAVLAYAVAPEGEFDLAERVARRWSERPGDAASLQLLGTAAFTLGAHRIASDFLTASIDSMRDQGLLVQLAQSLVMRAWSEIHLGRWSIAAPDAEEAASLALETAQPLWEAGAHAAQGFLAGARGDEARAEALASRAEAVVVPAGSRAVFAAVQLGRGVTALGVGRYDDAYRNLLRMLDPVDLAHHRMTFSWALGNLAEAALRIGEAEHVRELVAGFEQPAVASPSPAFRQSIRHARALLADEAHAEARFAEALNDDLSGGRFERARLELAYGAWLRRQRRISDSRAPLRAARDTFDAIGASPWSERTREELRAAGEVSQKREPGVLEQLTPQELQVAQMAANGLSNREIGQKLYLSHRTVGSHLYRIYPKLGVTARWQLGAVLDAPRPATA